MTKKVKIVIHTIRGEKKATVTVKEDLLHKERSEIRAYLTKKKIYNVDWM